MDLRAPIFTLKTLGTLDLRDAEGHAVRSVLAQPKRAALLIYLTLARPRGMHQRDTLLNLLWGERDQDRARQALRQALYYLRSSLGEDAIVTIGDSEVGVSPQRIWCDVVELERAIEERRYDDALAGYAGELLPGVHIEDASEFEQWLDAERKHVRARVATAAWAATQRWQESGELGHAVETATRAVALAPDDEAGVRRSMQLLALAGQASGALRVYDELAQRLRREYDAAPDRETTALHDEIRVGMRRGSSSTAAAQMHIATQTSHAAQSGERKLEKIPLAPAQSQSRHRVHRGVTVGALLIGASVAVGWFVMGPQRKYALPLDESAIAVLPFRVSGLDSTLRDLETGMLDLLAIKLNAANAVRAVDPRTVLFAWEQTRERASVNVPLDTALAIAARVGAGRLLIGSLVGTAANVALDGTLYSVPGGKVIGRAHADGAHDDLLGLIDEFAAQALSVAAGEDASRIEDLTTRSLPALQAYLAGRAAYHRGDYANAVQEFARALSVDTTFALAGIGVMVASDWVGNIIPGAAPRARRLAWANRDRLSERDRLRLLAFLGFRQPEPTPIREHIALVERALELMPDNPELWYELGEAFMHDAALAGIADWHTRARASFERAVQLDSTFADPLQHVAHLAAERRDTTTLRRALHAYQARFPTGHGTLSHQWLLAVLTGDSTALRHSGTSALNHFDNRALVSIWRFSLGLGLSLHDAERALAILHGRAASRAERIQVLGYMQALAFARGRPDAALRAWREHTQEELDEREGRGMTRGLIYSALYANGNAATAIDAARELARYADAPLATDSLARAIQLLDICALELWRLSHGVTRTAATAIAKLRSSQAARGPVWQVREIQLCAALIDVLYDEARGDPVTRLMVFRLDSVLTAQPLTVETGVPPVLRLGNLVAARLWEAQGDLDAALAALQRRNTNTDATRNPTVYLREECRLAMRAGRRQLAREACERFLALMSDPEPSVRSQVEQIRTHYARFR